MNRKAYQFIAWALLITCICSGFNFKEKDEENMAVFSTAATKIMELQEQIEEEKDEAYQEDPTQYGNTIGNQYNDGVFITDEDTFYFFNSYEGALCKTDMETGDTVLLEDLLVHMQLRDGILYGTRVDVNGGDSPFISLDTNSGKTEILRETAPQYLQMADGIFYFTDLEENNLRKLDADTGKEEIILNESVYYPVVYKDWIFFQLKSDKQSLYRIPKDGGEPEKLNDVRSYYPQIYKDRIYYTALENDKNSIRSMKIDGRDEQVLYDAHVSNMNLYNGILYFVEDGSDVISYLDLEDLSKGKQTLDLKELILKAVEKECVETGCERVTDFKEVSYYGLNISGDYMFFMLNQKIDEKTCQDIFIYDMNENEIIIIPEFCKIERLEEKMQAEEKPAQEPSMQQETETQTEQEQAAPAVSSKDAEARAVAQAIADSIPPGSDLERVSAAAAAVAGYCNRATYTTDDPDYKTAYGVFCKGVYTCAGATRAMGMVLDCMGYKWAHVNPNMWTHQWCQLEMDGQLGYADGQGGIAGYGKHPMQTE